MFEVWNVPNSSGFPCGRARSYHDCKAIIRAWHPPRAEISFLGMDSDQWESVSINGKIEFVIRPQAA